jgi:hypothetical protein
LELTRNITNEDLKVIGNYDLVDMQGKDQFAAKNGRLKKHRNAM